MAAKNIYTNIVNVNPLPFNIQEEVIPKTTIFSSISGENVEFDVEGIIKYPLNVHSLTEQPISELARHALGLIGTYEVLTTKMVTDCLNLFGIQADSKHVLKACERLRKTGLINAFRFKNDDNCKTSCYIMYIITRSGESALRSLGITVNQVDNYNVVMDPANTKKKLMINQILIAHLKHNKAVTGFEKSKRYDVVVDKTTEEHVAVKPTLVITFNDESSLFYEVVRKSTFWKTELENKLLRYKILQDNWEISEKMPQLVICCENEEHAKEVYNIVYKNHLDAFFTHDLMFFGEIFNRHLFKINDKGEIFYFKVSFDEAEIKNVV